jgi:dienelactone hydrolase
MTCAMFVSFANVNAQANAGKTDIKGKEITYTSDGVTCKGYISYDAAVKGKRPGILVVPEWWGCNAYARKRADMLAALGYTALAVDIYGEGKQAETPEEATKLSTPFYSDPKLAKSRLDAAEKFLKAFAETNGEKIGAIGYCFGGSMVLNSAKQGADYKGAVSFHGGLAGVQAGKGDVKGKILVCHGAADKFVSADDVKKFRRNLDSVGVAYTFKEYADAQHAFTNRESDANGKKFNLPISYNEKADKESWEEMKRFLKVNL